jgi:hypothetical protein
MGAATVRPLPSDTDTPTPTLTLTPSVTPIPSPTYTPVFSSSGMATPERDCGISLDGATWTVEPASGAPEAARADWSSHVTQTITAAVTQHDEANHVFTLQSTAPATDYAYLLRYSHDPPPIAVGRSYRFESHQNAPGQPPAGSALRIDDDKGVLFYGASVRETEGAADRLLGGDKAGFRVTQLPTTCRYAPIDKCGYELRAAPVEIARGDKSMSLAPGRMNTLASDPPYQATIYTSHYRLWTRDTPCTDPTDWILSYELVRATD